MTMYEVYQMAQAKFKELGINSVPQVVMNVKQKRDVPEALSKDVHPGTITKPVFENQVAAIFLCKHGNMPTHDELDEVTYNVDAFSYALLFPRGEQSYVKERLPKVFKAKKKDKRLNVDGSALCVSAFGDEEGVNGDSSDDSEAVEKSNGGDVENTRVESGKRKYISRREFVLYIMARRQNLQKHRILGNGLRMQYSKGMAIALRMGKPDLFITFTGNSEWSEIKENLPGKFDSWITDPLLCVRVFYNKLRQLMKDLKEGKVFGEVLAYQVSVEFQQRGMPHAHILVTLSKKFMDPEDVDRCISATIPPAPRKDEDEYDGKRRLREYVAKFMIHGPCVGRKDASLKNFAMRLRYLRMDIRYISVQMTVALLWAV
ncbi:unnamed protein product [Cylicocyclus nassatus]|uniref:Helitron helicase-like domain-containing protein n=1 Tax=Cylicocyclus nassatus TaxID=53992 RepID=A0AA36GMG4_CYLNA|nr:unnamed protein product [Cylicocyclus nassatus]